VRHFTYCVGKRIKYTEGEKMTRPEKVECIDCNKSTSNYYVIKTNKGDVYRCEKCYESNFMRRQRNEYSNYSDSLQKAKKV
jgi:NAD-dependent SIR2 family protein deacetylase|tara:strand:- start:388 stop:630 length:243 start_codon:yes stop_codon:yes gene_type:complete